MDLRHYENQRVFRVQLARLERNMGVLSCQVQKRNKKNRKEAASNTVSVKRFSMQASGVWEHR